MFTATGQNWFYNEQWIKRDLKEILIQAGAVTLLVKVKAHRGDPVNEEADIRTEMGHHKEQKEVI